VNSCTVADGNYLLATILGSLEHGNVAFQLCMNLMDRYFHSSLPLLAHHAECYCYLGALGGRGLGSSGCEKIFMVLHGLYC